MDDASFFVFRSFARFMDDLIHNGDHMRQYFTGFFTAVCLTSSIFIFMGSKNKNLGDITVSSISIYPGKYGGGYVKTYNEDGKQTSYLGTGEGGVGLFGVHNAMGSQVAYFGAGEFGSGFVKTYNQFGKRSSYLGSGGQGGGILQRYNPDG